MSQLQKDIISYCIDHPVFFRDLVSRYYPLSKTMLLKYKSFWEWDGVAENESINWKPDTIKRVVKFLDSNLLAGNPAVYTDHRTIELIREYYNEDEAVMHYGEILSFNEGIHWDEALIAQYEHELDFWVLSENKGVKWSKRLLERFLTRWDYHQLARNTAIPWSISLFESYMDVISFKMLNHRNPWVVSNIAFIEHFAGQINWYYVFANPDLPWLELDLLERWSAYINWYGIINNPYLFNADPDLLRHNYYHIKKLSWKEPDALFTNVGMPWSIDLLTRFSDIVPWQTLSLNEGSFWTPELIEHFVDKWYWGGFVPGPLYDEDGDLLSETGADYLEEGMNTNNSLPWTIGLIKRFADYLHPEILSGNAGVWNKAFKPYLNDEVITLILRII